MLVYPEFDETYEVNEINSFGVQLERYFLSKGIYLQTCFYYVSRKNL